MKEESAAMEGQRVFTPTSSQDTEILDDEHEKRTSKGPAVVEEKPEEGLEKEGGRVKQTPKPKRKLDGARGGRVLNYGMNDQNQENEG
ncbi:hypothetical protein MMC29_002336 [Sticta canariensis]|nr:hypothetical protein [Sticta canariensis]